MGGTVSITFRCPVCDRHWVRHVEGMDLVADECPNCGGIGRSVPATDPGLKPSAKPAASLVVSNNRRRR